MMNLFNLVSACAVAVLGGYHKPHLDNHKDVPYVQTSSYSTFTLKHDYAYCLYEYYDDNGSFDDLGFLIFEFYDLDTGSYFTTYRNTPYDTFEAWCDVNWADTFTIANFSNLCADSSLYLESYDVIFFTYCVPENATNLVQMVTDDLIYYQFDGTEFFSFCLLNSTLYDYGVNCRWSNTVTGNAFDNNKFLYWPTYNGVPAVKLGYLSTYMGSIWDFDYTDSYQTYSVASNPTQNLYNSYVNYFFYFLNYNTRMPTSTYQQWYFYPYYLQCGSFATHYFWGNSNVVNPRNPAMVQVARENDGNKTFMLTLLNGVFTDDAIYQDGYRNGYNDGLDAGYTDGNNDGYDEGFHEGYDEGYSDGLNESYDVAYGEGYQDGLNNGSHYTFGSLFGAIADTPILMIRSLFDFDFFGVNLLSVVLSLFTGLILFYLLRKLL